MGPLYQEGIDEIQDKVGASGKVVVNSTTLSFQELGVNMQNSTVVFEGKISFYKDQPL
jgi:predicted dinucleotide-utilizing enzyme